ncbi:SatD family protein [Populibacterium corticicola]|uniref:SatD family protein n=1 Tax=Populibacterium corticicola TaxID=1812826 RepID=A0ABW5XC30_9MICO
MFVMTVDQQGSRSSSDLVPEVLNSLERVLHGRKGVALPFTRTIGDEIQGVLTSPTAVVACSRRLLRLGNWYVGIGVGGIQQPMPATSVEGNGQAFIHAREAVEDAKIQRGSVPASVRSDNPEAAQHLQALLRLIGLTWRTRSEAAWQAVDLLVNDHGELTGATQADAADALGVSAAAISKRLKGAAFDEEQAIYPLLQRLLLRADSPT